MEDMNLQRFGAFEEVLTADQQSKLNEKSEEPKSYYNSSRGGHGCEPNPISTHDIKI